MKSGNGVDIMDIERIRTIRSAIKDKKFYWSAGWTSVGELKDEEQEMLLGLVIDEDELVKTEAETIKSDALAAAEGIVSIYPESCDWRNVRGRDWTTPIKYQGLCKSCTAFATVAIVESNYEISKRRPYLNPDLSEADVAFCGGSRICGSGMRFEKALTYAKEKGISPESCFPYKPTSQPCSPCEDRDRKAIKIQNWRKIEGESQAKEWLHLKGPLMTGMKTYEDFYYYRGGIYKNVYGKKKGHHAIALIGYDDRSRYWIGKNSWGTEWGEKGWFRIAYGECGIGEIYPFYTVEF